MRRARLLLTALAVIVTATPAAAQVVYPPRAEKVDVQIRYRIRADRDERVRQFRVLDAFLKSLGFVHAAKDGDDQAILDQNAERFAGTVPSAKVLSILDDPRVKTILFAPAGFKLPAEQDAAVPIRLGIASGYLAPEQQILHRQVNELLAKLGFREMVGYDHRGHTLVRGSIPAGNVGRLLKDLRAEPSGWFFLDPPDAFPTDDLPPVRNRQPIRDTLPVRWVEVVPDADVTLLPQGAVPPELARVDPALRAALADATVRDLSLPVEIVYAASIEDRVTTFRGRLQADYPRAPKPGGGEFHQARLDGAVGNVLTIRFGRLADVLRFVSEPFADDPRFATEPRVIGVRLPRAGDEALTPSGTTNTAADVLRATRFDQLHALGYRGQGTKIVVIASGFPGVPEAIGKDLPATTKYVDLTTELNPAIEPLPPYPNRVGGGTAAAKAAHLAAPGAQLVLVRVNPGAMFQVFTVAKLVRGDEAYSDALQARILELADEADALRLRSADAVNEYREAFANLSDDDKPAARRKAAAAALQKVTAEERLIAERVRRSGEYQKSLKVLDKANVVVNTLVWETGYPLDSLSGLSQYLDRAFAGDATGGPRSRSATNPRVAFRPLWVQAASGSAGSVWSGPFVDSFGKGPNTNSADVPPTPLAFDAAIPPGGWTRELNFLALQTADGKSTPNLTNGVRMRLSVQWRETHDPNVYAGRDAIFPLTIRVFRQLDPTGQKRASDELEEVARSVGEAQIITKEATYGVYEQVVEMIVPADGRYAVRIDGRLGFDPRLPALRQHIEMQPRLLVEFPGAAADKGRPVFASYAPRNVGVGMPGDSKSSLTVGAADTPSATTMPGVFGGGPGLALLPKPDLLAAGSVDAAGAVGGSAVAAGFAAGGAAALIGSGANPSDLFRATGLPRGGPFVVPEGWLRLVPKK